MGIDFDQSSQLLYGFEVKFADYHELATTLDNIERTARAAKPAAFEGEFIGYDDGDFDALFDTMYRSSKSMGDMITEQLHMVCENLFADVGYEGGTLQPKPNDSHLINRARENDDPPVVNLQGDGHEIYDQHHPTPATHALVKAVLVAAAVGENDALADLILSYAGANPASLVRVRFVHSTSYGFNNVANEIRFFIALDASVFQWSAGSPLGRFDCQNVVFSIDTDAVPPAGKSVLKRLVAEIGIVVTRAEPGWMMVCTASAG
jgi:hypothetical protein